VSDGPAQIGRAAPGVSPVVDLRARRRQRASTTHSVSPRLGSAMRPSKNARCATLSCCTGYVAKHRHTAVHHPTPREDGAGVDYLLRNLPHADERPVARPHVAWTHRVPKSSRTARRTPDVRRNRGLRWETIQRITVSPPTSSNQLWRAEPCHRRTLQRILAKRAPRLILRRCPSFRRHAGIQYSGAPLSVQCTISR